MEIKENINLSKYTTIGIGGIAKKLYFPETKEDLLEVVSKHSKEPLYIISGGSNLLINDLKEFDKVISMRKFHKKIDIEGTLVTASASVGLSNLVNIINENSLGGIEYLYTIPGMVGGAVLMNAGRGKLHKQTISDYIKHVIAIDIENKSIVKLNKEECNFSHRYSVFKSNKYIILEVAFNFPVLTKDEIQNSRNQKLERVKKQDFSGRNFGSVFRESSGRIMKLVTFLNVKSGDVMFSKKTPNWIINKGKGTYRDVKKALRKVKFMHKIFFKKIELEIIVWD